MKHRNSEKRSLSDLGYTVASGVMDAIRLLQERYGASDYHDSGHTKTTPTWIFKLSRYGNAEVGVRMNKRDITLYMRDRTCDGKRLRDIVPANKVAKVYPRDGKPANSVLNSSYLGPTEMNEVLMLELEPEDVETVLGAFFGDGSEKAEAPNADADTRPSENPPKRGRPNLTEEELLELLERQTETGRAGELLVVLDEIERLRQCGCPDPERYVHRVATSDVGRGYDIESTWPGEERCIEVKSTTRPGSDFFITANERSILGRLGTRAWIYRVVMDSNGQRIEARLNNPMNTITEANITPVVWRVASAVLETTK